MSDLEVGMKVRKPRGYPFTSIVVCVFTKLDGQERVVCESDTIPGLLHIFSPSQLVVDGAQNQRLDLHRDE